MRFFFLHLALLPVCMYNTYVNENKVVTQNNIATLRTVSAWFGKGLRYKCTTPSLLLSGEYPKETLARDRVWRKIMDLDRSVLEGEAAEGF